MARIRLRRNHTEFRRFTSIPNPFGNDHQKWSGPYPVCTRFETIADKVNRLPYPESAVTHIKCKTFGHKPMTFYWDAYGKRGQNYSTPLVSAEDIAMRFDAGVKPVLSETKLLAARHLQETEGALVDQWNLITNVIEIRDIARLVKRISEYRYLDYHFGFAPLVADLGSLLNNLRYAFNRLNAMKRRERERFGFSRQVAFDLPTETDADSGVSKCYLRHRTFKSVSKMYGWFNFTLPPLNDLMMATTLSLDILGIHPDLATFWDLVPFSFMIDWFVPISDLLEQFHERGWLKPILTIGPGSVSYKYVGDFHTTGGWHSSSRSWIDPGADYVHSANGGIVYYKREIVAPTVIRTHNPDLPGYELPKLTRSRILTFMDLVRGDLEHYSIMDPNSRPRLRNNLWRRIF